MRDDPYPARFYGRQVDEPFLSEMIAILPTDANTATAHPLQQPLSRVLLLLMTLYLCCALFLIFAVTTYAAPIGSGYLSSEVATACIETAIAAR